MSLCLCRSVYLEVELLCLGTQRPHHRNKLSDIETILCAIGATLSAIEATLTVLEVTNCHRDNIANVATKDHYFGQKVC